jgi:hypothetical protein
MSDRRTQNGKARETSRSKSCVANLKQIEAAKEQWCMDNKQAATATPGHGLTLPSALVPLGLTL